MKSVNMWVKPVVALGLTMSLTTPALASKIKSSCYLLDKAGETIQGVNLETRYEIASVSKVMTSLWAVAILGAGYRYETKVYTMPVSEGTYDVHIAGSNDPFYNREQFQFLLSELNQRGIKKIRTLSFDEDFKYLASTRQSSVVVGHYGLDFPSMNVVESQLKTTVSNVTSGYDAVVRRAKEITGQELPAKLDIKISEIKQVTAEQFANSPVSEAVTTQELIQRSVPLNEILKEMNRSSNNYAANVIFESLGGAAMFQLFAKEKMNLEEAQIRFLNGSGDRHDYEDGTFAYNEASCAAIIATVGTLKAELENQKHHLEDVMAVAGIDAEGEKSTVTGIYANEFTSGALIAKTGTVSPAITLAGLASTEQGDVYFGSVYGTDGSVADWRDARNNIRKDMVALFKKFTKKKEITLTVDRFLTFDQTSRVQTQAEIRQALLAAMDQAERTALSQEMAKLRAQQQAAKINSQSPGTIKVNKP